MNAIKLLLTAGLLGCFSQPVLALRLIDVPSDHPAAATVAEAIERYQLFEPYPDQTFRGEQPFTRYQLAQAGYQMLRYLKRNGTLQVETPPYHYQAYRMLFQENGGDLPQRHWAVDAIQELYAHSLLNSDGPRFNGGQKVSRYALAQMLQNLLNWMQLKTSPAADRVLPLARDLPAGHWARPAVENLLAQGILSLNENGDFQGDRLASQYELASALVKALKWIETARLNQLHPSEKATEKPSEKSPAPKQPARRDGKTW